MAGSELRGVLTTRRANAALAWALVVLLVVVAVAATVTDSLLRAGFVLVVAVLAAVPAVAARDVRAMLPWEVLALAAVPLLLRTVVGPNGVFGRVTTFFAVAGVALVIAVELEVFTPVRMNHSFAVLFVVLATMAAAGVWAVAQWLSDLYLGTAFLLDGRPPEEVERDLMWDFVAATGVGVVAGLCFEYYFRRRIGRARVSDEVAREAEP
jgi:hypothetical protein